MQSLLELLLSVLANVSIWLFYPYFERLLNRLLSVTPTFVAAHYALEKQLGLPGICFVVKGFPSPSAFSD